jgi:hypothetical protein
VAYVLMSLSRVTCQCRVRAQHTDWPHDLSNPSSIRQPFPDIPMGLSSESSASGYMILILQLASQNAFVSL